MMAKQENQLMHDDGTIARYDDSSVEIFEQALVNPVVDYLAELAGDGRAPELGIGTGRIALHFRSVECRYMA